SLQLSCSMCSLYSKGDDRDLHSFPTRRSSDLSTLKSAVLSRERERTPHCRSVGAPRELREKLADPPRRRFEKRACSWFRNYPSRSEEHTSELQSLRHLVCRLLLEKKNKRPIRY